MLVSKTCQLTGTSAIIDVPADPDKLKAWLAAPRNKRPLVQQAFPELSAEYREFLITGILPGMWDELFGGDDEA